MAVFLEDKKEYVGVKPVFWIEPAKKDVMGYRLTNVVKGQVIVPGTPIKTDEVNKTAVVCHYAVVKAVATDKKTLTVEGGHYLTSAMKVAISGNSSLTALNLASVDGDTVVLSAQNSTIKAGDVLVEVDASGDAPVVKDIPNRIVVEVARINSLDQTCSATHEAWVIQNMVYYPAEYLNTEIAPGSIYLKGCLGLKFMYQ
jgi:hypothetical protein